MDFWALSFPTGRRCLAALGFSTLPHWVSPAGRVHQMQPPSSHFSLWMFQGSEGIAGSMTFSAQVKAGKLRWRFQGVDPQEWLDGGFEGWTLSKGLMRSCACLVLNFKLPCPVFFYPLWWGLSTVGLLLSALVRAFYSRSSFVCFGEGFLQSVFLCLLWWGPLQSVFFYLLWWGLLQSVFFYPLWWGLSTVGLLLSALVRAFYSTRAGCFSLVSCQERSTLLFLIRHTHETTGKVKLFNINDEGKHQTLIQPTPFVQPFHSCRQRWDAWCSEWRRWAICARTSSKQKWCRAQGEFSHF